MSTSEALATHHVLKNSIGNDPDSPTDNQKPKYDNLLMKHVEEQAKKLMNLAKLNCPANTMVSCKKCGEPGHFSFQCMNFIRLKGAK